MKMQQQIEESKERQAILLQRQKKAKAKTEQKRQELEAIKKLGKTVDKVAKELGIDE